MVAARGEGAWASHARMLLLVAMAVFLVTIAIGIPNGLDAVDFNHDQVLTHVHSGTVGWLTLSIVAGMFLVFRASDGRLAAALAVLVPVYVAAFYTGNLAFRAISGTALLVVVVWLVAWAWRTFLAGERTLPRLGLVLAITTFTYGAIVGVLLQVAFASSTTIVPGDGIGAHAGAMTFGYLVLAGMAIVEWRILGSRGLPLGGLVQMTALFLGGAVISVALLAMATQVGGMIYLLAELIAVVLFAVRIVARAVRIDWAAATAERHLAAASLWIVVALAIFMYLVAQVVADPEGTDTLNAGLLIASDHSVYIGVITNCMFALLTTLLAGRAGSAALRQVAFWGMNLGLLTFAVGLITGTAVLKQVGAPVMGVCLLVGLGVYAAGLLAARSEPAPEALAASA